MFLSAADALFDLFVQPASGNPPPSGKIALAGGVGGSPMNVAIGLARLGHHSRYLTRLSTDVFGVRMREHLLGNQIDLALCPEVTNNTTLAMVQTEPDGSARYAFYTEGTADTSLAIEDLPTTLDPAITCVHVGSYSTATQPSGNTLLHLIERERANRVISYDPNVRLPIEPDVGYWRELFARYRKHADVVKASDEDIIALYGEGGEQRFVDDCLNDGASLVFITRGDEGADGFDSQGRTARGAGHRVDVVDTVGAGDTFQATVLHWLASQGHLQRPPDQTRGLNGTIDLQQCLTLALTMAAVTCTRRGADMPGIADLPAT